MKNKADYLYRNRAGKPNDCLYEYVYMGTGSNTASAIC